MSACSLLSLLAGIWLGSMLLMDAGNENLPGLVLALCTAILSGLCARRLPGRYRSAAIILVMGLMLMLTMSIAMSRHLGTYAISLSLMALLIPVATVLMGVGAGLGLTALCSALLVGLTWAEWSGLLTVSPQAPLFAQRLLAHTAMLLFALAIGCGLHRMMRRILREAIQRTERFRDLLRISAEWYWEMDREFRFTYFTEDRNGASGLDAKDCIGKTPWEIDGIGQTDNDLDAHRADLESHRPFYGMVARRLCKDGSIRYVSISGEPRFDTQGSFNGYWGVGRDVTSEVQAEHTIVATETRYRELFRRSPSPLVLHRWGRVMDANPAAMAMFGYTQRSSMIGQDLFSHYEAGDDERARQQAGKLEAMPVGALSPMAEFRLRTLSRRRRLVQATSVRVESSGGAATLSFFIDQTEAARAQEALRRSEGLLSHLVATSPDVITVNELTSAHYVMVNKTFEELSGYSSEEAIGHTSEELGIWYDRRDREKLFSILRENGRVTDMPAAFITKSGETIQMVVSAAPFSMDGKPYMVLNARDVTETERTRLVQQAILENASIGICLTRDHHFVQVNRKVEEMFGWPDGSLVGQHSSVVWPDINDFTAMCAYLEPQLKAGQQVESEIPMRRRDGGTFLCRVLAKAVDPHHPSLGGTIWILEDVTERRRVEAALAKAKDEAQAASRAKSHFLANTSHEIRTPLNGMLGLARMLQQPNLDEATRREYLDQMLASSESLAELLTNVLDLSKIEAGRFTLESVPFALRDMLRTLRIAYVTLANSRGLSFKIDIDEAVPAWVVGDPTRTRQIISNYLSNAIKFTEQGSVELRVARAKPDAGENRIRIEVNDTGPGIEPDLHARLFDAFTQADESTTRRFGGTGLGLSICRELASLMGGDVGVQSAPGLGSTFWAELPLPATLEPVNAEPVDEGRAAHLRGRRVLMVEDNPVNMMIAVAQLEQWGLEVSQASDGSQAVEAVHAAASMGKPFDAVLMDVQMPVMSGHEATREIRRHFDAKALPIVALTAAALVSERDEALAAGMNEFLTKPLDAPRLQQVLLRLIGQRDLEF